VFLYELGFPFRSSFLSRVNCSDETKLSTAIKRKFNNNWNLYCNLQSIHWSLCDRRCFIRTDGGPLLFFVLGIPYSNFDPKSTNLIDTFNIFCCGCLKYWGEKDKDENVREDYILSQFSCSVLRPLSHFPFSAIGRCTSSHRLTKWPTCELIIHG
jgi:hypothetical protein